MISSFIHGRLRLRHERFKDPQNAAEAEQIVGSYPGVVEAKANTRTGSFLIKYDPQRTNLKDASDLMAAFCPEAAELLRSGPPKAAEGPDLLSGLKQALGWSGRRQKAEAGAPPARPLSARRKLNQEAMEYLGLTAAFLLCLGAGFLRAKGLHVYSGLTLAGLTAQHIYRHRRRLWLSLKSLEPRPSPQISPTGRASELKKADGF